MKNLIGMKKTELEALMGELGEAKFRAAQLYKWVYSPVDSIDDMTNIPKVLKEKIKEHYFYRHITAEHILMDEKDGTKKFLFRLEDGNLIESVLMNYSYGSTICISSQVGCRMGCKFCASTIDGLVRNLSAGEMTDQIMAVEKSEKIRISNIVIMGSGEPFDNFDEIVRFIELANDSEALNKGQRHITISTCGLVPEIYKLADMNLQVNLSVSLHAPTDILRKELMPVGNKYKLDELLKACKYYTEKTNRKITFEYAMIKNVNDSREMADKLAYIIMDIKNAMVNLIPVNPIEESSFEKSDRNSIYEFNGYLISKGVNSTVRRKLGSDINAACGQLRRGYTES